MQNKHQKNSTSIHHKNVQQSQGRGNTQQHNKSHYVKKKKANIINQ